MGLRADEESRPAARDGDTNRSAGASSNIPEESVREALNRLLADPQFHASARNRRFLHFVVEDNRQAVADVRSAAADAAVAAAESILARTVKDTVADNLITQGIADAKTKLN